MPRGHSEATRRHTESCTDDVRSSNTAMQRCLRGVPRHTESQHLSCGLLTRRQTTSTSSKLRKLLLKAGILALRLAELLMHKHLISRPQASWRQGAWRAYTCDIVPTCVSNQCCILHESATDLRCGDLTEHQLTCTAMFASFCHC